MKKGEVKKILIILLLPFFCASQNETGVVQKKRKNAVYFELLGNAGFISLNYDRKFRLKKEFVHLSIRQGITVVRKQFDHKSIYATPSEFSILIGKQHFLEIGVGITPWFGTSDLNDPVLPEGFRTNFEYDCLFRLGYRFESKEEFVLRIAPLGKFYHSPPQRPDMVFDWTFGISLGGCF